MQNTAFPKLPTYIAIISLLLAACSGNLMNDKRPGRNMNTAPYSANEQGADAKSAPHGAQPNQPNQPGQPGQIGQASQNGQTGQGGQTNQTRQTGQTGQTGQTSEKAYLVEQGNTLLVKIQKNQTLLEDLQKKLPASDAELQNPTEIITSLSTIAAEVSRDAESLQAIAAKYHGIPVDQSLQNAGGLGLVDGSGDNPLLALAQGAFRMASKIVGFFQRGIANCVASSPKLEGVPANGPWGLCQLIKLVITNLLTTIATIVNSCLLGFLKFDAQPPPSNVGDMPGLDTVVDVPLSGPYGTRTFSVAAATNWVNSGLFLKAGQSARITAQGQWMFAGHTVGARGDNLAGNERGCRLGSLVARSGLSLEGDIFCVGTDATFVATKDETLYVGMITASDVGEGYGTRLGLQGALTVTVVSEGGTVPTLSGKDAASVDLSKIGSGHLEIAGRHIIVSATTAMIERDRGSVADALDTLDRIYETHTDLRGMHTFNGQRIRFISDPRTEKYGYMIAGNPIRTIPDVFTGHDQQRILRAGVASTDIWGFAHELGHTFTWANGARDHMQTNYESWPNVFTIHALTTMNRLDQPNLNSYCDKRSAYLQGGSYPDLKSDAFLQLCFLMEFQKKFGWPFWNQFYNALNKVSNAEISAKINPNDVDRSVWTYVRDRFSNAAGQDVTPMFQEWHMPVR